MTSFSENVQPGWTGYYECQYENKEEHQEKDQHLFMMNIMSTKVGNLEVILFLIKD